MPSCSITIMYYTLKANPIVNIESLAQNNLWEYSPAMMTNMLAQIGGHNRARLFCLQLPPRHWFPSLVTYRNNQGKDEKGGQEDREKIWKRGEKKSVDSGLEIEDIWGRASTNIGMIWIHSFCDLFQPHPWISDIVQLGTTWILCNLLWPF